MTTDDAGESDGALDTVTHRPGRRSRAGGERRYLILLEESSSAIVDLPAEGKLVVGRAPDVDLQIRDRAASRRHAELLVRRGGVELVDLGSHNRTRVNGEEIEAPRALLPGDVITIGETSLVFHAALAQPERLVDAERLRRRLQQEVERAGLFGRPLAVVVLEVSPAVEREALARAAEAAVRPVDFLAWLGEQHLALAFPELPVERLPEVVERLAALAPKVRAGRALYPDDGLDAASLIAAARRDAAPPRAGQPESAAAGATKVDLGDRSILLADPAMVRLFALVKRLARSDLPVLISGETGVGKESAAYAVHHWSQRGSAKFLPLNCAALPDNLLESELFGFEKGAFSGAAQAKPGLLELASGGTVFLDEVGEMQAAAQAKLLRVLETKRAMRVGGTREVEVDIRIVAATNRDLEEEVAAGRFRRDLFYRLSGATVVLPPLRDRPRELVLLTRAFLAEACARLGRPQPELAPSAVALLARYGWPGNVRELKNAMDFIAAAAEERVEPEQLPERITSAPAGGVAPAAIRPSEIAARAAPAPAQPAVPPDPAASRFRPLADEMRELERARLKEALAAAGGVKARAARLIGMPLRTFVAKVKQYELAPDAEDP